MFIWPWGLQAEPRDTALGACLQQRTALLLYGQMAMVIIFALDQIPKPCFLERERFIGE